MRVNLARYDEIAPLAVKLGTPSFVWYLHSGGAVSHVCAEFLGNLRILVAYPADAPSVSVVLSDFPNALEGELGTSDGVVYHAGNLASLASAKEFMGLPVVALYSKYGSDVSNAGVIFSTGKAVQFQGAGGSVSVASFLALYPDAVEVAIGAAQILQ